MARKTLLFFDEIQEVPNGIPALKYFCEDKRELHVVVAGSLLGISLREEESYPVGKVDNLRMYPMTYDEILLANGREMLGKAARIRMSDKRFPRVEWQDSEGLFPVQRGRTYRCDWKTVRMAYLK